jgi:multiple sugar transport system permease protein
MIALAKKIGLPTGIGIVYLIMTFFFGLPLLWLFSAAFSKVTGIAWAWPTALTLDNFSNVFKTPGVGLSFFNAGIYSIASALVALFLAALAGYPLSRFRFRGRLAYMLSILFITGLPITAMIVPMYEMFLRLGWVNTRWAVVLMMGALATPISIWLLKAFIDSVDPALEEASWVDGANRLAGYFRIIVPLMRPGLVVVFILNFLGSWSNFYVPFVLFSSTSKLPVAVTIYEFFGNYGQVYYGQLAAFSLLYSVPVIGLYLLSGGRLGSTLNVGGVKG